MITKLLKYIPVAFYPPIVAILLVIGGMVSVSLSEYTTPKNKSVEELAHEATLSNLRQPAKVSTLVKPNSKLVVQLEEIDNTGNDLGEYYLRGIIAGGQELNETVEFQWIVPDFMSVVTGSIEGSFEPQGSKGPWEVRLRVYNPESQWQKPLVLTVQTLINGKKVGNAAAYRPKKSDSSEDNTLQKNSTQPKPLPDKIFF